MRRLKTGEKAEIKRRIKDARDLMMKYADDVRRTNYQQTGDLHAALPEPELPTAQDLATTMRTVDALLPWPVAHLVMIELLRHAES